MGIGDCVADLCSFPKIYRQERKIKELQTVEIKVRIDCEGCEHKVRKAVEGMEDMSGRRRSSTPSASPSSSQRGNVRPTGGDGAGPSVERPRIPVWLKPKADGSGTFTLEPSNLVLSISKRAYQSRMNECWPRWTMIPDDVKMAIWEDFLGQVEIQTEDFQIVQRHWHSKIATNYRESLNAMKQSGKKPNWMSQGVWEDLLRWWENDQFQKESARNSANRSKNPVTHRGGSKSFQHHREDLERQRGGPVSRWDVFTHTHALGQTNDQGQFSYSWDDDDKARSAYEKFMEARATMLQDTGRSELTVDEENAIFDSIMDQPTRGRRYGFGNQSADVIQGGYQKAQDKEEVAMLRAEVQTLHEQNRHSIQLIEQLNQKVAEFIAQYGRPPSSGGATSD